MADGNFRFKVNGFDSYTLLLGEELRGERATLGKSLLQVQKDLKIKAAYISAIENCDLNAFPNKGFIAGYVRSYARYLNLNPEEVYERFCTESGFSSHDSSRKIGSINIDKNKSLKNMKTLVLKETTGRVIVSEMRLRKRMKTLQNYMQFLVKAVLLALLHYQTLQAQ